MKNVLQTRDYNKTLDAQNIALKIKQVFIRKFNMNKTTKVNKI